MSETLALQNESIHIPDQLNLEQLQPQEYARQQLLFSMIDKQIISRDFYESGAAESFFIDEKTHVDALSHLLVGDEFGGGHHLPTMFEVGQGNVSVASRILQKNHAGRRLSPGQLRKEQRVRDNGAFKSMDILFTDEDGTVTRKNGGSTMFPNEWTTQQVLEAVITTSQQPSGEVILGTGNNEGKDLFRHNGEVDGVKITAITDSATGKIITAYPRV